MRRTALLATFVNAVLLLGPVAAARAGDVSLDGVWERDDKKTYRILGEEGIEVSPRGEFGCRFHWTRVDDDQIAWKLRFTRLADEGGYLTTTAVTTTAPEGATPQKLEMDFEWVDLDDKGAVRERGNESHTLKRTGEIGDHEAWIATNSALGWHARIDAYLVTGSPEYDLDAALDCVGRGLAANGYGVPGDKVLLSRQKALAAVCARGSRPRPKPPVTIEVLSGLASEKVRARVTNTTTRPIHSVGVYVRPQGGDGKDLVPAISTSADPEKPLEAGESVEVELFAHPLDAEDRCETAPKALVELSYVAFEDGTQWEPYDAPMAATATLPAVPLEIEYLGQVPRQLKSSEEPLAQVGWLRVRNATPGVIRSFAVHVRFLAADGRELGTASNLGMDRGPLRPGHFAFAYFTEKLPEGTKTVTAEASLIWFAPSTHERLWEKGKGFASPE